MKNEIKILCPGRKCRKCARIVSETETMLENAGFDYELEIESRPEEFLKYPTWILPTVLVNGHVVARGYAPDEKTTQSYLHPE